MSDGISDSRRPLTLDDIEAYGLDALTPRQFEEMVAEIRDLRSRTRCHCVRAAGLDGQITKMCIWHDEAARRAYGAPAQRIHELEIDVARLSSTLQRVRGLAAQIVEQQ